MHTADPTVATFQRKTCNMNYTYQCVVSLLIPHNTIHCVYFQRQTPPNLKCHESTQNVPMQFSRLHASHWRYTSQTIGSIYKVHRSLCVTSSLMILLSYRSHWSVLILWAPLATSHFRYFCIKPYVVNHLTSWKLRLNCFLPQLACLRWCRMAQYIKL